MNEFPADLPPRGGDTYEPCTDPDHPEFAHHHITGENHYLKHWYLAAGCPDTCPEKAYQHVSPPPSSPPSPESLAALGLMVSKDGNLINWLGDNYVRQTPRDFEPSRDRDNQPMKEVADAVRKILSDKGTEPAERIHAAEVLIQMARDGLL